MKCFTAEKHILHVLSFLLGNHHLKLGTVQKSYMFDYILC